MAYDNHSNLACSKITAVPVDAVNGTAFDVVADDGQLFSPNQPVTMWPDGPAPNHDSAEIGYITAVSGDTITITRAQEGTQALSVAVGWNIAATLTAKRHSRTLKARLTPKQRPDLPGQPVPRVLREPPARLGRPVLLDPPGPKATQELREQQGLPERLGRKGPQVRACGVASPAP